MKQAVTLRAGHAEFRTVDTPTPSDHHVLVQMEYVGICGSDLHIFHGEHPFVPVTSFPLVQGHEGVGTVVEVGAQVQGIRAGDTVAVNPQLVCGACEQCRNGRYNICQNLQVIGCQTDGLFSEYVVLDPFNVMRVPETIPREHAAMVEPLAVAVRAIRRAQDIVGKKVLIFGGGTIGNLVAQVARAYGAHRVMVSDLYEHRLKVAKEQCGVDYTVQVGKEDLQSAIDRHFGSDGADIIFECVGIEATMESALIHSAKGKELIVVGVFGNKTNVSMALVQNKEIDIKGVLMYKVEDYIAAIDLMERGAVHVGALLFRVIPFEEYPQAYALIDTHKDRALKVLVNIQE